MIKTLLSLQLVLLCAAYANGGQKPAPADTIKLTDLAAYANPGKNWRMASAVTVDPEKPGELKATPGNELLVNLTGNGKGSDLYTTASYGDIDLDLEFVVSSGVSSGIYLQGRYEVSLADNWGIKGTSPAQIGGIYERWNESKSAGYDGHAARQNAGRGPGLWQRLKISFQAPRFDASGKKIANARIISAELNGVLIHENIELTGPTKGAVSADELAQGPLRLVGDQGAIAFRNIKLYHYTSPRRSAVSAGALVDPIWIDAPVNTTLRSFMDVANGFRVVKAISVGSPEKVHYTYDLDRGAVIQAWRGGFLDATPMWNGRGNGTSRPLGVTREFGTPVYLLSRLASADAPWPQDTVGAKYRTGGYLMDNEGRPQFWYTLSGTRVTDIITALPDAKGIERSITVQNPGTGLYACLASAATIKEIGTGWYLIGEKAWYLHINTATAKPVIRNSNGHQELIVPVVNTIAYSILF